MRGFVNPHKSAAHKLACLSLYRGLLKQSTLLSDKQTSSTLISLIRRRFRLDRKCQSLTTINDALESGRRAYVLVQNAANGSPTALSQLNAAVDQITQYQQEQATLRRHQNSLRSPTSPAKSAKIAHLTNQASKDWAVKIPNPIPISQRPVSKDKLPHPEQPRRVPNLTAAQGFPFLRYKSGAQSPKLTRVLNDLYTQEFKRWEIHNRLLDDIDHALLEDGWDKLIALYTDHREEIGTSNDPSWADDTRNALRDLQITLKEAASKRANTAQQMWSIVQQEKELATMEKRESKEKATKDKEVTIEMKGANQKPRKTSKLNKYASKKSR